MTETKLLDESVPEILAPKHSCAFLDRKVCVVLTAYDDEEAIPEAVKEFLSQNNVIEVVVVDNNSRDNTGLRAMNAGARVVHEERQGYGFACIRGLVESLHCDDAETIVLAEGDMTFRGRDIWKMLPFLDDVDMVVGSRTHMALVDKDSQMNWFYLWGNLFLAKVLQFRFMDLKFLGRTRFTDVGCTMRAINKDALLKIINDLEVGDHHFAPHMTKIALKHKMKVIEVPLTLRKRVGISKGASGNRKLALLVGLKMLWHIVSN